MANITVPNTSTFEQWRVKTNDISDAVGDVDDLTSLITGGTDVVASLTDIKDVSDTNTTSIGTIGSLYGNGTYTDLVSATGDLDTRTTTNATNITSNDVDIATNLASIGTIGSLYGSQEDLVSAAEDLDTRTSTNLASIGTIGSLYGNGTYTDLVSATGDLDTRTSTNATNIGTIVSLYGSHEDLVSAIQGIESFPLTNSAWDGTDGLSLLGALNNHEGRLDTEEINVDNLQGDVGAWSVYEGLMEGNSWDEDNITAAIINIRNRQDDLTADFVDVTGDIMTGSLTFSNDSSTGVFGTTTLNIGASSQTYITVAKDGDNDWGDIVITGNASVSKNLTVTGDLLVDGTTTTINTETVTIHDNIIILNSNATSTPSEDAGFEIERGDSDNSSFLWIEDGDYWEASDQFRVDNLKFDGNTISSINTNTIEITPSGTGIIDLNANKLDISDCIIIVDTRLNDGQLYIGQDGGNVTRTTLTEGEGINIANATGSITISAEVSTLENAGIAKFSSDNFLVSSGEVTIKDDGIILGTETTGYYVKDGVTSGLGISGEVDSEGGTFTVTSDATADNTASTIVYRDGTKNFKVSSIEVDEIKSVTSGGNLKLSGDGDGIVEVTDELKVSGDATITGDLTVSGTTTTTNTETVQIQDNIMLLNVDAEYPPLENSGIEIYRDAPDINITDTEFTSGTDYTIVSLGDTTQVQWNTAAGTSGITYVVDDTFTASGTGVGTGTVNLSADRNKKFLWDEGNDKWTVGSETMVAAIFEGDLTGDVTGDLTGNVTGDLTGNAGTASGWETGRTITLTGDIAGTSESWDGTGNISFAATIQANSVALGTDTTGNYVGEGAVSGTGLSGSLSAEGGTFTVTSNATDANTASTIVARDSAGRFKITDPTADQDAATKAYVDTKLTASDLDFQGDSGGALSIDLESEILDIAGGTGITSVGSVNTVTLNIDSTVATLTGTQTLTNKSLTSPAITGSISGDAFLDEDDLVSDSATKVASQQSIKAYVDGAAESRQDDIGAMISTKVTASDYVAGDAGITYQIIDPTGTTQTQWEAIGVSGTAVKGLLFTGAAATGTGSGTMAKPATHSIQTNVSVAYDDVNAGISFVTPAELTADITGNAGTATTLETARNIGGVSFNGSENINLPGVNSAGNQNTSGNAGTATTLETARNIGGVSFNGSENINLPGVNSDGNQNTSGTAATVTGAAQSAITSLGTLTALTVDDVVIDGRVITMTGSTDDTAVFTAGTNGTLSIVTTDASEEGEAANITITADGTVDINSAGALTLDSGDDINLEPAAGSKILLDGTISIDAGVVTGATSITSTAFVGDVTGAASLNLLKVGDTMGGAIAMGTNKITGVGNPTADQDAATKSYVDGTPAIIGAMISTTIAASDHTANDSGIVYQIIDPTDGTGSGTSQTQWEAIGVPSGTTAIKGLVFTSLGVDGTGDGTIAKPAAHSIQTNVSVAYDDVNAGISFVNTTTTTYTAGQGLTLDGTEFTNDLEINQTATGNLGLGSDALNSITDGDYNVALGEEALTNTDVGTLNTGIGWGALAKNTGSDGNTAVGAGAMYGSTVSGAPGANNTALGYSALSMAAADSTGHNNVALGVNAGVNITSGSYNIVIGANEDAASATSVGTINVGGVWKYDGSSSTTITGALTASALTVGNVTLSGNIIMSANKVTGMGNPTLDQDAATKSYVDTEVAAAVTSEMSYKGAYDADTNSPNLDDETPVDIATGDMYTVTVAGTFFATDINITDTELFTSGTDYTIVSLGNTTQTQWEAIGVPDTTPETTADVGVTFTASSGTGVGTGTVNLSAERKLEVGDVLIAEVESPTTKAQWTVVSKDLDAASIKTLYEGEDNAFTDAQFTKLGNIAINANDYDLPEANATTKGGIELFSNTVQTTSATAVSDEDLRTYGLQLNSDGQAVVNVPWATPGVSDVIVDGSTVNGRSITINNSGPTTTEGYNNGDVWFEY